MRVTMLIRCWLCHGFKYPLYDYLCMDCKVKMSNSIKEIETYRG